MAEPTLAQARGGGKCRACIARCIAAHPAPRGTHREISRPAYRFSAEDSIYLHPEAAGKGLGKQLLTALVDKAEAAGVRKLIAVIGDSANVGSVGVHRALGFQPVGTIASCGWKFGRWLDIVLMDRVVGAGDGTSPEA